ncbi:1979_t:CDS:1 [Paraglomus brasilianum]|uniref:1979_t:CDS:1 n=1 Tax=Paraglomus brasilianum TaxID=144538 RepID=A0A9N9BXR2_9GLOM|nr:1979_t:CDS:1 [Paraglomus brasilianum]
MSGQPSPTEAEESQWYTLVRENIIAFLLFLSPYIISYITLRRFRRFRSNDSEENEDNIDNLIIMFLCAAGLAMAMAGFLLLPCTMAATALINLQSENLNWLDTKLLATLWNYTFIGCNVSLFALLPFAYFYSETDQRWTFFAKARETLFNMTLVAILMYGFIYVSKSMLQMDDSIKDLVVLNLLTSLAGSIICLNALPRGYAVIVRWIGYISLRPNHRRFLNDELVQNQMDASVWEERLESINRLLMSSENNSNNHNNDRMSRSAVLPSSTATSLTSSSQSLYSSLNGDLSQSYFASSEGSLLIRERILAILENLETQNRQTQFKLSQSPLSRNLSFLVLFIFIHITWLVLIGAMSFNLIKGILLSEDEEQQRRKLDAVLGKQTSSVLSMFGTIGTLSEMTLIFCFTIATIIGTYSMSPFAKIRPQWGKVGVQQMIANVTVLLIISSSLPAVVRVLGLTRFEHTGPYDNFHVLKNRFWIGLVFRTGMLFKFVIGLLDLYVVGSLQMVRRSMINNHAHHANGSISYGYANGQSNGVR